jgi:hypothetical protein
MSTLQVPVVSASPVATDASVQLLATASFLDDLSVKVGSGIQHEIVNGEIISIQPANCRKYRAKTSRVKDAALNSDDQRRAQASELIEHRRRDALFEHLARSVSKTRRRRSRRRSDNSKHLRTDNATGLDRLNAAEEQRGKRGKVHQ